MKTVYCFTPFEINMFQQKQQQKHDGVKEQTNTSFELRLQGNYNVCDCCIRIKPKHAKGKQRPPSIQTLMLSRVANNIIDPKLYIILYTSSSSSFTKQALKQFQRHYQCFREGRKNDYCWLLIVVDDCCRNF